MSSADPEARVRSEALLGPGFIEPDGIVASVLPLLDDEDDVVRGYAAATLGRLGDTSVLPTLRAKLDREDQEIPTTLMTRAIADLESGSVEEAR